LETKTKINTLQTLLYVKLEEVFF